MKLYADTPARRTRQITADVVALVAIVLFVLVGKLVHDLIAALGQLGVSLEDAGSGFSGAMSELGDTLGGIPIIGSGAAAPFQGASGAGETLAEAGRTVQGTVEAIAIVAGLLVAIGPILVVLLLWLLPRLRGAVRAGRLAALVRSGAPLDLIALRALSRSRLAELVAIDPDPAGAWRRGDPGVIRELARLELRDAGVALPG